MAKTKARFGRFPGLMLAALSPSLACTGVVSSSETSGTSASGAAAGAGGVGGSGAVTGSGASVGSGAFAGQTVGSGGTGNSSTGGGGSGGSAAIGTGGTGNVAAAALDSGRVVLRRLNRAEYNNTVRDLLGTMTRPADRFAPDEVIEGFDTAGEALHVSALLGEQLEAAAGQLVDELLGRPSADPLRARVLVCEATEASASSCYRQILSGFMRSAYRRPVTDEEVTGLVDFAISMMQSSGDVMRGLNAALKVVLLSPHFLFRVELGDATAVAATPLNDHELASRLSYFLWSTMPDPQLMQAADAAELAPLGSGLDAQIERMLAHPNAQALVDNFAGQWLMLRDAAGVAPDADLFPVFDEALRVSIPQETGLFFKALVDEAAPLATLLLADFTIANDRLANHYGLTSPGQSGFARVSLAGSPRIGLLTQETFLTVTSSPDRTSPVRRGDWVLDRILCDPPDPPPPGTAPLVTPEPGSGVTLREAFERHRADPKCMGCHSLIDPIGLGFENFDAIGSYRTTDNGIVIQAAGVLPEGGAFTDVKELAHLLAADPRFAACMVRQALTYGVGRSFDAEDARAYVAGLAGPLSSTGTWRDLLRTVAKSQAFTTRRGEAP